MTKNKTQAYGQKILSSLRQEGWELENISTESNWYATEHWKFRSLRQAFGTEIFLSFMIDPQDDAYKHIFGIRAGSNIPTYFHQCNGEIAVLYIARGCFKNKLCGFVEAINGHRNMVHEGTGKFEA